ncbi:hypothetical protein C2857_002900 [Epichloe festucae Fl1]|uniref:Uncharacterized protein n=1 Tax=Epichloe festucae (strain Fl1) TaxID=877507 RepID=A0A7S9PRZ1_EPIFF|nr:hypothetical protein C2857_002900 [Epichloe festucae Fl1]
MSKDHDDYQFYGHPAQKLELESRVRQFDASEWIDRHGAWGAGHPARQPRFSVETAKFHNPYAGVEYAWQLTETLNDFLSRLPPATTKQTEKVPWIFICNPFVAREEKRTAEDAFMRGNEDEAPAEGGSQLSLVVEGAMERLQLLSELTQRVNKSGKSPTFITRELSQERRNAVTDILSLAHAGRWMLFCPPSVVNELWEVVARATANNELGVAAKVAPRSELDDPKRDRPICIYTSDFSDKADVGRVLQRMRELRIADSSRRNIYYKPGESNSVSTCRRTWLSILAYAAEYGSDIFTYVGIATGNPWELAASLYSSKQFPCSREHKTAARE